MQVILQPLLPTEGSCVVVETNSKAIISSLISTYCAQKGFKYDGAYTIYDEKKRPLPMYSTLSALGIENGQTLLIGKEDSSFNILQQWPIIVALATIIIGLIGILTISLVYGLKGGEYFDDYGVVMDAGSTKTNTIVYKWKSNKYKGTGQVSQEDNCYAKGGIAEMNPMHLEPVINCAKNVTEIIEPRSIARTPLFFAATAGMRLLNSTNPSRAKEILKQLSYQLPETNLDVKEIEIISGRDEGIYGWITINFLQKTLEKPQKLDPWEPTTYAALDMGGASLQIAYAVPNKTLPEKSDNSMDIQLYGQTHSVFSQSTLCFGREQAEYRYHVLLWYNSMLTSNNTLINGTVINDPCAPEGFENDVTGAELFKPICTHFKIPDDVLLNDTSELENITFIYNGTSDPVSCRKRVSDLLNDTLCKHLQFKECFKKHTDLPNTQKFIAFATYFYTTDFLNITNVTLEEFEASIEEFCLKNIDEVMALANNSYGPQYCFNAHYIHEVLLNGFGFNKNTWENVKFVGKISGKDVGWTLGYMINATNIIPEKATPRLISTASLTVSVIIFILLILATAIFLLYTCKTSTGGSGSSC